MTLRQLEYFLAVVDERSFTAAAARLHVSQPTLSQQIRSLEREVGGSLLRRRPGPLALTPAGKAVAEHAQVVITSARRALDAGRRAVHSTPRVLVIATVR